MAVEHNAEIHYRTDITGNMLRPIDPALLALDRNLNKCEKSRTIRVSKSDRGRYPA